MPSTAAVTPPISPVRVSSSGPSFHTSPFDKPYNSSNEATRHSARLTFNFPILPHHANRSRERQISPSPVRPTTVTRQDPVMGSPRLPAGPASPTESSKFLTLLAAQERKVLELREELQASEQDLASLKKQWAACESNKKKRAVLQVEKLQSLQTSQSSPSVVDSYPSTASRRASADNDRGKLPRKHQPTVFPGSRQTRTLSLLSPSNTSKLSFPQPSDITMSPSLTHIETNTDHIALPRSATLPSLEENYRFGETYKKLAKRRSIPQTSKDNVIKNSKHAMLDVTEGLFTFFEDIKQATAGNEGVPRQVPQASNSVPTIKLPTKSIAGTAVLGNKSNGAEPKISHGGVSTYPFENSRYQTKPPSAGPKAASFWRQFGVDTPPGRKASKSSVSASEPSSAGTRSGVPIDLDDDWDHWESPMSLTKSCPLVGKEAEQHDGRDTALPWPELKRLTPSKLTRTVSDLMKDWDSSAPDALPLQSPSGDSTPRSSQRRKKKGHRQKVLIPDLFEHHEPSTELQENSAGYA